MLSGSYMYLICIKYIDFSFSIQKGGGGMGRAMNSLTHKFSHISSVGLREKVTTLEILSTLLSFMVELVF